LKDRAAHRVCTFLYIFVGNYYTKSDIKHKYFFSQEGIFAFEIPDQLDRYYKDDFFKIQSDETKTADVMDRVFQRESGS